MRHCAQLREHKGQRENAPGTPQLLPTLRSFPHTCTHKPRKICSSFSTFNIYPLPTYSFLSSTGIYLFTNRHHYYPQKTVAIIKAKLPWNRICQKYLAHTFFPCFLTFAKLGEMNKGGDSSLIVDLEDTLPGPALILWSVSGDKHDLDSSVFYLASGDLSSHWAFASDQALVCTPCLWTPTTTQRIMFWFIIRVLCQKI